MCWKLESNGPRPTWLDSTRLAAPCSIIVKVGVGWPKVQQCRQRLTCMAQTMHDLQFLVRAAQKVKSCRGVLSGDDFCPHQEAHRRHQHGRGRAHHGASALVSAGRSHARRCLDQGKMPSDPSAPHSDQTNCHRTSLRYMFEWGGVGWVVEWIAWPTNWIEIAKL